MWKPKDGEKYWYINEAFMVESVWFDNEYLCKRDLCIGNCFRTKKKAQETLRKIKAVLRDSHKGEK
jgi:hypothetical protein